MNEWASVRLGDVSIVNPRERLNRGDVAPFIEMASVSENCAGVQVVGKREVAGGARFRQGDTLVARITPCLENGKIARVPYLGEGVVGFGSTEFIVLRGDGIQTESRFLTYLAQWQIFREYAITNMIGSSGRQRVSADDIRRFTFLLPPLSEQKMIAGVLGAFDDLIETNQNLSRQMRQISEAGFKQSTEGRPLVPLGSMVELAYGKALPARVRVPGPVPVVSSAGITGDHDTALVSGPGVVVGRKGTVGSITWVRDDFYPIDTTYFAKSELAAEIMFHILQRAGLEGLNTDSAVPGLNRDRALQQLVPEVDKSLANEIASWLVPLMLVGDELMQEAVELARQRDELLPLLMSGRVRVSELEKVP